MKKAIFALIAATLAIRYRKGIKGAIGETLLPILDPDAGEGYVCGYQMEPCEFTLKEVGK